jgi:hypothetical protein
LDYWLISLSWQPLEVKSTNSNSQEILRLSGAGAPYLKDNATHPGNWVCTVLTLWQALHLGLLTCCALAQQLTSPPALACYS